MNLEIANRLLALRREHGYSQEELAYKLGVSRQAVSKWERAESSPDTDNLLALARLYGVSLDALLLHTPAGEAAQAAPEPEEAPAVAPTQKPPAPAPILVSKLWVSSFVTVVLLLTLMDWEFTVFSLLASIQLLLPMVGLRVPASDVR